MLRLLTKSKWLWITLTFSLVLLIVIVFFTLIEVYLSNHYWKNKFKNVTVYKTINDIPKKIILSQPMKQWIKQNAHHKVKYYRVVVKGYGAYGELLHGSGVVRSNIKHFYLTDRDIFIDGNVLRTKNGIFCGSWQLIPITPEQFIYNKLNSK